MQKTQSLAFFSVATGILAVICLFLIAAALHDIMLAIEPSLSSEWYVVKVGFPIFVVLQVLSIYGIFKMLKNWRQDE